MICRAIENLLYYAVKYLELDELDVIYCRNAVMHALMLTEYADVLPDKELVDGLSAPDILTAPITVYAVENRIIEDGEASKDLFETKVLGLLCLRPSEAVRRFNSFADKYKACCWLYDYSIKSNYIKLSAVSKNMYWVAGDTKGRLELTINLSKPEKDNKETARLMSVPSSGYPKCALCRENTGFYGNLRQPPRNTLRTVPISLCGEDYFIQFSPFVYYDHHLIVINKTHTKMNVVPETVCRLLDFIDQFPFYFVGCNASLPIVGGSILAHDHFQGGLKALPLFSAGDRQAYKFKNYRDLRVSVVDFYNSVIRIAGKDRERIGELAGSIIELWQGYSDESAGIIAYTDAGHNAITPVARMAGREYIVELILRNNRTDPEHPGGIFHAHSRYHNIKSESIGLIEAMGFFILPGRLKRQLQEAAQYLAGKQYCRESLAPDMQAHADMIERLINEYGTDNDGSRAQDVIMKEVGRICEQILINTAVFKPDEAGQAAFRRFMELSGRRTSPR